MSDGPSHGKVINHDLLEEFGLSIAIVRRAIQYTHDVLDRIDNTLIESGSERIATLIELANLSAIVGNLFRNGVSKAPNSVFKANRPHAFPDLVAVVPGVRDIEIKVALESNKPKGHLIKPGPHLIVRYVLADKRGKYVRGKSSRGAVVWIWEIRIGLLKEEHFSFSNTPGDSGKTAVINAKGIAELTPIFIDLRQCPYSPKGPMLSGLVALHDSQAAQTGHIRNQT